MSSMLSIATIVVFLAFVVSPASAACVLACGGCKTENTLTMMQTSIMSLGGDGYESVKIRAMTDTGSINYIVADGTNAHRLQLDPSASVVYYPHLSSMASDVTCDFKNGNVKESDVGLSIVVWCIESNCTDVKFKIEGSKPEARSPVATIISIIFVIAICLAIAAVVSYCIRKRRMERRQQEAAEAQDYEMQQRPGEVSGTYPAAARYDANQQQAYPPQPAPQGYGPAGGAPPPPGYGPPPSGYGQPPPPAPGYGQPPQTAGYPPQQA